MNFLIIYRIQEVKIYKKTLFFYLYLLEHGPSLISSFIYEKLKD